MDELEAEAKQAEDTLKANEANIERLQAQTEQQESRLKKMEEVEADAARVRETLAQRESALGEAQGRLEKMSSSSDAAAELDVSLRQLESLRIEMERSKQESKEKRAALVDSALKSLVQLSQHMAYMLAGLRLGQRSPGDPPPVAVLSAICVQRVASADASHLKWCSQHRRS